MNPFSSVRNIKHATNKLARSYTIHLKLKMIGRSFFSGAIQRNVCTVALLNVKYDMLIYLYTFKNKSCWVATGTNGRPAGQHLYVRILAQKLPTQIVKSSFPLYSGYHAIWLSNSLLMSVIPSKSVRANFWDSYSENLVDSAKHCQNRHVGNGDNFYD